MSHPPGRVLFGSLLVLAVVNVALMPSTTHRMYGERRVPPAWLAATPHAPGPPAPDRRPFIRENTVFRALDLMNFEVIPLGGGRYRMLLHTADQHVRSALSTDGASYRLEPGDRLHGSMTTTVRLDDGRWRTCFCESPGGPLVSAVSRDGLQFALEDHPVIGLDPQYRGYRDDQGGGQWMPQDPFLLETPEGERLFYYHEVFGTRSAFRPRHS